MSKITVSKKEKILKVIIKEILPQYTDPLTLRQLYYRVVSKFAGTEFFENKQSNYQYLSKIIVEARLNGTIPFDVIEDRTRGILAGDESYVLSEDYFERYLRWLIDCKDDYDLPKWHKQEYYIEVWLEKQALSGLFVKVCDEKNVILSTVRGYPSLTMLKDASTRLNRRKYIEKQKLILYFGDMDPSGQDIPRHIEETLNREFGCEFSLIKCAITKEQIEEYNIPPMPAKSSDSRFNSFTAVYGEDAVELDAIEPDVLQQIIREKIEGYYDKDLRDEVLGNEVERGREEITKLLQKTIKKEVLDRYA